MAVHPVQEYVCLVDEDGNAIPGGAGITVQLPENATATVASVGDSATVVTLKAANAARMGLTIYNTSSSIVYVKMGSTATASDFSVIIPANGYWEMPCPNGIYTGIVTGIWASDAGGAALVTEW